MINTSELRFGNFIIDDDGCFAKVTGFKPHDHLTRCDTDEGCQLLIDVYEADGEVREGYITESKECRPIELTPEWLGKMGFKKTMFKYPGDPESERVEAFINGRYVIRFIDTGDQKGYRAEYFPYAQSQNSLPGWINYVHQLQNKYFWWTDGDELVITQPIT